jgi:hypothetical protein
MDQMERYRLKVKAQENRREQLEAVSAAAIKLHMLGLTPENGMVNCPPPANTDPLRWRAMIRNYFYNEGTM